VGFAANELVDLPPGDVAALEQYVDFPSGEGVMAGAVTPPVAERLPAGGLGSDTRVKVLNLSDVMTCGDSPHAADTEAGENGRSPCWWSGWSSTPPGAMR
jgi:hypothetical protein